MTFLYGKPYCAKCFGHGAETHDYGCEHDEPVRRLEYRVDQLEATIERLSEALTELAYQLERPM